MCLAVPGRIKTINNDNTGVVDFMGIEKKVAFDLIEDPRVGHYVIVHAGFAINTLDEKDAQETLRLFREIYTVVDETQSEDV